MSSQTGLTIYDVTAEESTAILQLLSKLRGKKPAKSASEEDEDEDEEEEKSKKGSSKTGAKSSTKSNSKKKPEPEDEEDEESEEEDENEGKPTVSLEKIKKKIADLADDHDEEIEALFKKYKLKKVSALPENKYDEFWKALSKIK